MSRKPKPRDYAIAQNLLLGQNASQACRNAGLSEATAESHAYQIVQRDTVKQAMMEIAKNIKPGDLGNLSKAILQNDLLNPPEDVSDRTKLVRLGLETDNMIGPKEQLHLHQHSLPPVVEKLLEDKMRELLTKRGEVIDVTPENV